MVALSSVASVRSHKDNIDMDLSVSEAQTTGGPASTAAVVVVLGMGVTEYGQAVAMAACSELGV